MQAKYFQQRPREIIYKYRIGQLPVCAIFFWILVGAIIFWIIGALAGLASMQ